MADADVDESSIVSDDIDGVEMDLFWKGAVKPNEPLVIGAVSGYFLRITNASLGPDVQKNTRSCLQISQQSDEEADPPGVVCTLKNSYENHALNLVVSDDVQFTVAGENPSSIYLVGYYSPQEKYMGEPNTPFGLEDELDDDDEPTEEELQDMDENTKRKLLQGLSRKRKLNEIGEENEDDEEDVNSPQKKQKTLTGKAKPTNQNQAKNDNKNNQNPNQNKNQNKNQNPNQNKNQNQNQNKNQNKNQNQNKNKKQAEETTPKTQESTGNEKQTEEGKTTTETKKEGAASTDNSKEQNEGNKSAQDESKEEGWKNGPQGIKYKDLKSGDGKPVKKGAKLRVFYVGQLPNKKVFDKTIEEPGFEFKLGGGEVIQGWEKGLFGMKAGGKRRLIVPAKLAYGEEGSTPDIPPNTDLTFTIEVKEVK